jgi:hypothetical protein
MHQARPYGVVEVKSMAWLSRQFAPAIRGLCILLLGATQIYAQTPPAPLRGAAEQQAPAAPAAASPQPAASQAAAGGQPQSAPPVAPSLLQQPAKEAQIVFAGDTLSIRADNSSLAAILHEFAAKSGMQVEGLGGDERVFGSFGPGAPSDVLADLLNGTAYNLVLLGDLSNGAPRELILTPSTHGGAAPAAAGPLANSDEASSNDQESADVPPQPEVPAPGTTNPPAPGVRTPQQLFEQLQKMRQAQQNSQPTQQDPPLVPQ